MIILYADDNSDDIENFEYAIKDLPFRPRCHFAADGREALKILDQIPTPDYIFLDMNMPAMDGSQTLLAIRANERFDEVPVYVLSTLMKPELVIKLVKAGAADCITKPFDLQTLTDWLGKTLK